ncbi:thiamine-phosphate kinase [Corynebacterium halotolerans]|uniref:Thiamine-monophosphate kinase n=1 Tax=Corynebacterium halotolerans YIM 70093 = DSM 44683 TaxID=1121362 RepID=M1P6P1_9CORY|nr:thiamine-phosphate kinase [Corynebacterium halotolerans]AGF72331.1 thiamine monophosphate kinase [Corynebacterium halotolerans YIM 70093 = DSM 44683]
MTTFPARYAGPTLGEVGEHRAIEEIISAAPSSRNGDDAAVLSHASPNSRAVATTDMLIEGRHFKVEWSTPEEVGCKAIVQNFADVEAMGARPLAALLAISAPPHTPVSYIRGVAAGIADRAGEYSAELVGGDLTSGAELVLSVTAIGSLGGSLPELTLDRARPGQRIVAHGRLGWSAAGLALLDRFGRENVPAEFTELVEAHCAPRLNPGRGVIARATGATAMTDNSDGLVADLGIMARRSGVGIDLHSSAVEPDELLLRAGQLLDADPWEWVLAGGEDHTLLAATAGDPPSGFRSIARVTRGEGVTVDGLEPAYGHGWVSF